jgi:hypothetical protein
MDEDDAGDALVTVILEEQPFDPPGGDNSDAGLGDGTGSSKCGDCPPLPPHVPGGTTGESDSDCATIIGGVEIASLSNVANERVALGVRVDRPSRVTGWS